MGKDTQSNIRHMLSFDVEEYFHCEAFRAAIGQQRYRQWPSRIDGQMAGVLELLGEADVRATFFVLGKVAKSHPQLVRDILAGGHEVACHGHDHEMIARLGPLGFRQDTLAAKALLEDLTSASVLGYRAATFGLVRRTAWAIDILAELGFAYDSSVQPIRHDRYGVPDAPQQAHWAVGAGGARILEIPPMTHRLVGLNIPLGGGGYFRLMPVAVVVRVLREWARQGRSAMLYLHPWEFDPGQPVVPIGTLGNIRHRVNLGRTAGKLRKLLQTNTFCPVRDKLAQLKAGVTESFAYAESPVA